MIEDPGQRGQPSRVRLGVVVEKSDKVTLRKGNTLVVSLAKAAIVFVLYNDAVAEGEANHFSGTVAGPIVDHNHFPRLACLTEQRVEAKAQKFATVPVHYYD